MAHDTKEFWNEMWSEMDEAYAGPDDSLVENTKGLAAGRALDAGCGTGENAVWLAEQGWTVTAIDYSDVAISKARKRAKDRGVNIDFTEADASTFQPEGRYDLITSFYIHLIPEQRVKMLAIAADALAPGGTLLFVSHDESGSPLGWSDEDKESLTTPEQVASEIRGLKIEQAYVKKDEGAHVRGHGSGEGHESHNHHDHDEGHEAYSTIVRAVKAG